MLMVNSFALLTLTFGSLVDMERFTGDQRAFCVRSFYLSNGSYVLVRRQFRAHYQLNNLHQTPSGNLIKQWLRKFEDTGSTSNKPPGGRRRTARSRENIERVRLAVERNPRRSVRKQAFALNLHRSTVQRVLKQDLKLHPYKIQLVQALKPADYPTRLTFANEMFERFNGFNNIIFSDEAHFHLDGYVNKQNCRYWSANNPREKHQQQLHSPKVTVWAAMSSQGIIGPFFLRTLVAVQSRLMQIATQQ